MDARVELRSAAIDRDPEQDRRDLVEKARHFASAAAPFVEKTEALRRMSPEVVELLIEADFGKAMAPRTHGGLELGWSAYLDMVNEIALGSSGSIAWCASFLVNHLWLLHFFERDTVDAVYAAGRTPRIVTSLAPLGKVRKVDGGYMVEGAWPFGSGADHCEWAIVGTLMPRYEGAMPTQRLFLLRPGQFSIKDSWNSVGLRGSGSNTIVVAETFVAEDWTLDMAAGEVGQAPGQLYNDAPIFKHSIGFGLGFGVFTGIMGTANAALESFLAFTRNRLATYSKEKVAETQALQIRLGECTAETVLAREMADRLGERALRNEILPGPQAGGVLAHCVERLVGSVDRLFMVAGARGLSQDVPLQRHWRDIHAMSNHAGLSRDMHYQAVGRYMLGLDAAH